MLQKCAPSRAAFVLVAQPHAGCFALARGRAVAQPDCTAGMQYIHLPSGLTGFHNSMTTIEMAQTGRKVYLLHGELERARFLSALRAVRKCTSISRGGELFPQPVVVRKSGYVQRYEELIRQNQLFFTLDIIKDKLANAYKQTDEAAMAEEIANIMDICTVKSIVHHFSSLEHVIRYFCGDAMPLL